MAYPGKYCELAGIDNGAILTKSLPKTTTTNGLVLELYTYTKQQKWTLNEFVHILSKLDEGFTSANVTSVVSRITKLNEQKKALSHKKKVKGVKNLTELLSGVFVPPKSNNHNSKQSDLEPKDVVQPSSSVLSDLEPKHVVQTSSSVLYENSIPSIQTVHVCGSNLASNVSVQTEVSECHEDSKNITKKWNLKKYLCNTQTRKLRKLRKQTAAFQSKIDEQNSRLGHYSIKNVNKRDETARKNLRLLREAQRKLSKCEKKAKVAESALAGLTKEVCKLQTESQQLTEKTDHLSLVLQTEKDKKLLLQKANSYLKKELSLARNKQIVTDPLISHDDCDEKIIQLKFKLEEKQTDIDELYKRIEEFESKQTSLKCLKSDRGIFTDELRLCIIDLFGLEIGVEKISPTISVVSKHLFNRDFKNNELPSASTVQNIVDEGHFLAKTYISEKLASSTSWGICRDGTTRKKKKIVDTAVTLDSGDIISLGFDHVARETGATITEVTQKHMNELANAHCQANQTESVSHDQKHEFVINSLQRLSFTMSDRASNEKLANKLLSEWRDEMLSTCSDDGEKNSVKHFHCMAHVLLGFHRYVSEDLKSIEQKLIEEEGPIGRDKLPVFKNWSKKEASCVRAVRTTADIFGPCGDHTGLRDRWEAYCSNNGIKSFIGNYKDNRFNGLFQTAAQICAHHSDFLKVIKTVKTPNLKLQSVLADLESETIQTTLQCLALIYVRVTGPYWSLITSGNVTYLELHTYVQSLTNFLRTCELNPNQLLREDFVWLSDTEIDIPNIDYLNSVLKNTSPSKTLLEMISSSCKALLKTIQKQLSDFLEGEFSSTPSKDDLARTACAKVTNLGCEHHFGDLDSSQRRRPNASIHHHTSVQLLKRNRKDFVRWFEDMPASKQQHLMKTARACGPSLRRKHMEEEDTVRKDIYDQMMTEPEKKRQKISEKKSEKDIADKTMNLPHKDAFKNGEYVAIAYQDNWYPGCVERAVDKNTALVRFMTHCRKHGHFQWPLREDKQIVKMDFVLKRGFVPNCVGNGRMWFIEGCDSIDKLYCSFDTTFFG